MHAPFARIYIFLVPPPTMKKSCMKPWCALLLKSWHYLVNQRNKCTFYLPSSGHIVDYNWINTTVIKGRVGSFNFTLCTDTDDLSQAVCLHVHMWICTHELGWGPEHFYYRSVPQICPPSCISPPGIFSTKFCWGIFIPCISPSPEEDLSRSRITEIIFI